jgi:hypothetical protein
LLSVGPYANSSQKRKKKEPKIEEEEEKRFFLYAEDPVLLLPHLPSGEPWPIEPLLLFLSLVIYVHILVAFFFST